MRVAWTDGAPPERRDALAGDWGTLLGRALDGAPWLPIPNLGADAVSFAERWHLDALILTGGNDLATSPERDATERALLAHCLERGFPVLGVCRGLQLVHAFFGGAVRPAGAPHAGGRLHEIRVCHPRGRDLLGRETLAAPSYHRFGVPAEALAQGLEAFALAPDGIVEGLFHRSAAVTAVQWHPERPLGAPDAAVRLLRRTLG
jgi:putative glutamine amidotransferase